MQYAHCSNAAKVQAGLSLVLQRMSYGMASPLEGTSDECKNWKITIFQFLLPIERLAPFWVC